MKPLKKLYYSIGEVSERMGEPKHVLRYWETEFNQLHPKKNRAGNRIYTDEDIALLEQIRYLLREMKYTVEGAKQVLLRTYQGAAAEAPDAPLEDLHALRAFLAELLQKL